MKSSCQLTLLAVLLSGCIQNEYGIELAPAGDSLERKLTSKLSNHESAVAVDDEVKRLAREYHVAPPARDTTYRFQGRFAGKMPSDVGGSGIFTRWNTPLGSTLVYVERFRGNDDAAGELKRRQATANRLTELFASWLEQELKDDSHWPALQLFLDEDLRRDLYNVSIYAWTLGLTEAIDDISEPVARVAQYLVERGYFTYDEIPAIKRAVDDLARGGGRQFLVWLKRMIVVRMGFGAAPPLEFLTTTEGLGKSLSAFLETTEEYKQALHGWQQKAKANPKVTKPDAMIVAFDLLLRLLLGGPLPQGGDQLTLALKTGRPAVMTNGRWSPEFERTEWSRRVLPQDGQPSTLAYAVWDEPDEKTQNLYFGLIALQGKMLVDYCLWYGGLTGDEQLEWDSFLGNLRPKPALATQLQDFRFNSGPIESPQGHQLAKPAVDAILGGLNRSTQ